MDLEKIINNHALIEEFLMKLNPKGYTSEGRAHYMNILQLIKDKMFNPDKPESKFVTLCAEENWVYANSIADVRNKEAIECLDMFRKFVSHIKNTSEYITYNRDIKLNTLINE